MSLFKPTASEEGVYTVEITEDDECIFTKGSDMYAYTHSDMHWRAGLRTSNVMSIQNLQVIIHGPRVTMQTTDDERTFYIRTSGHIYKDDRNLNRDVILQYIREWIN